MVKTFFLFFWILALILGLQLHKIYQNDEKFMENPVVCRMGRFGPNPKPHRPQKRSCHKFKRVFFFGRNFLVFTSHGVWKWWESCEKSAGLLYGAFQPQPEASSTSGKVKSQAQEIALFFCWGSLISTLHEVWKLWGNYEKSAGVPHGVSWPQLKVSSTSDEAMSTSEKVMSQV